MNNNLDPKNLQNRRSAGPSRNGQTGPLNQRSGQTGPLDQRTGQTGPLSHRTGQTGPLGPGRQIPLPQRGTIPNSPPRQQAQRKGPPPRPNMPNGQKKTSAPAPSVQDKKMGRNVILATILLVLVLITVIIFSVQSCTKDKDNDEYHGEDNVILNTTAPEKHNNTVSIYAKYTDKTAELSIESGYGILIDLDTNTVIASKGGDEKIFPASMTKVMTLIVAYENIKDLDNTTYTFSAEMLDEYFRANASVAGFSAGETVTAKDLIYGAILPSGGDATGALAELVGGDEEGFAALMNEKVKDLGLKNTHFVTASGLHDDNHYSTCHDMAVILRYALNNPFMRSVLSAYKYTTSSTEQHPDGITLTSTLFSRMAGDEVEGLFVQGGKTGYTIEAKNCLCTFAANCREDEAATATPQYILVTALASGNEYVPVFDAIDVYGKYCTN